MAADDVNPCERELYDADMAVRAGDLPELQAFLEERIHEYNAAATGYYDGEAFSAMLASDSGEIEAGVYGFTWGGCCFISHLWVSQRLRGQGLGTALLQKVERHALARRCKQILLSSHSFQAPAFYARRGFEPLAHVRDYPVGHSDILYTKRLEALVRGDAAPAGANHPDGSSSVTDE